MTKETKNRSIVSETMIQEAEQKIDSISTAKKSSATAALQKLKVKILAARRRGVSLREIAEVLKTTGIDVSEQLIANTCGPLQKRQKTEKVVDNKAKNQTVSTSRTVETKLANKTIDFKRDSTVTVPPQKTKLVGNATYDPAASLTI